MSPTVAGCRRSLGQILGQPMLPRALFSLLCVADARPYPPDDGLIRELFLAEPVRFNWRNSTRVLSQLTHEVTVLTVESRSVVTPHKTPCTMMGTMPRRTC